MTQVSLLTIGEVARRAGVRTSTLRYDDDEGLVVPSARVGGRRRGTARQAPEGRWRGLVDARIAELDAVVARAGAMAEVFA